MKGVSSGIGRAVIAICGHTMLTTGRSCGIVEVGLERVAAVAALGGGDVCADFRVYAARANRGNAT